MGPNNICYVTRHFLFFPYVPVSLFIRPWRHLIFTVNFMKGYVGPSTTFKVAVSHIVFCPCGALTMALAELMDWNKWEVIIDK